MADAIEFTGAGSNGAVCEGGRPDRTGKQRARSDRDSERGTRATGMKSTDPDRLLGPILQSVSRSFYLSIRFLPSALRRPIGLAYLLARATDTIADTTEIRAEVRLLQLQSLAAAIQ